MPRLDRGIQYAVAFVVARTASSQIGGSGILDRPVMSAKERASRSCWATTRWLESKRRATARRLPLNLAHTGCPGGARLHPGCEELLLLLGLGLLRLLCLLRFLSHSILSEFNGLKRDTRHARRRASLAKSSSVNSADSRRAASRCHARVITLSTADMRFDGFFAEIFAPRAAPRSPTRLTRSQFDRSSIQNHGTESIHELRVH